MVCFARKQNLIVNNIAIDVYVEGPFSMGGMYMYSGC